MAKLIVLRSIGANLLRFNLRSPTRSLASGLNKSQDTKSSGLTKSQDSKSLTPGNQEKDTVTHTGQVFEPDDYRRSRYLDCDKYVNTQFPIDLIQEEPVIVCTQRVVASDNGGHPVLFINLDQPGYHTCGYSGRRFVLKKHYDEKTMGPSITYEQYLEEIGKSED